MKHVRTTLSARSSPGALRCPGCALYTNRQPTTSALRQLSSHIAKKHPAIRSAKRFCNGPTHEQPAWLPVEDFNRRGRRYGGTRECKKCERALRELRLGERNTGYVQTRAVAPYARALRAVLGGTAAANTAGVSLGCFYNILQEKNQRVRRGIAAKILAAYRDNARRAG